MADKIASPLNLPQFNVEAPDLSKINMAGYNEDPKIKEQIDTALDQNKKYADALEERYANPNWFKIAAGFAKPQLGGFVASLGSAAEAAGDWQEQQRMVAPTVAKMRAQNAIYGANLGQQKAIEDALFDWRNKHPNEPYPAELMSKAERYTGTTSPQTTGAKTYQSKLLEQQVGNLQLSDALKAQAMAYVEKKIDPTPYLRASNVPEPVIQAFLKSLPGANLGGNNPSQMPGSATPDVPAQPNVVDKQALAENDKKVADLNKRIQSGTYGPEEKAELNKLKAERAQIMAGAPASTSSVYYPSSFTPSSNLTVSQQQNLSSADVEKNAKLIDAPGQSEFSRVARFNKNGQDYTNAMADTQAVLDAASSNKKSFVDVTDIVRRAGPLAAASAEGFGVHIGPYGVNITLPVKAYEGAKLSPEERAYSDMIINKIATSTYYGLLARGVNPETAGAEKFNQLLLQETTANQSPVAIKHALETNKEIFKHSGEVFDIFQRELNKTNPNSLTKLTDILNNSKELSDAKKRHLAVRTELSKRSFGSVQ